MSMKTLGIGVPAHRRRSSVCATVFVLTCMAASLLWGAEWQSAPLADGEIPPSDAELWRPYRGAKLEKVSGGPGGKNVLRVTVAENEQGGFSLVATPRGGMGNRVRTTVTYRVVSGSPVSIYVGPNTLNQLAGVLKSREWETATMEVGVLTDFHLVVHAIQRAPDGVFELADFKLEARAPSHPLGPARVGVVDVAMDGQSASDPALAMRRSGNPSLEVDRVSEDGISGSTYHITAAKDGAGRGRLFQGLGALPAGAQVTLRCRGRVTPGGKAIIGLESGAEILARDEVTAPEWASFEIDHMLERDGPVRLFVELASDGPLECWVGELHAWVELPDPLAPGVVPLGETRRPIHFDVGDAKSIRITPPWPDVPPVLCHLEYNSRWGFRFPTSHEVELSKRKDELRLTWHFQDDPVTYEVRMKADRPDSVLVEARLQNGSGEPAPEFTPGFCLQLMGAYSPKTFAYTIIPRDERPFPLSMGRYFTTRAAMWANVGWVNADYTHSPTYPLRLREGDDFEPANVKWIHESGDFPLLVRRLPGRDAWIAWIWPNATRYFGNTQSPCMHMDPIIPSCPPGESSGIFGRMVFFEGSWEDLYALARRERADLKARSGRLDEARRSIRHRATSLPASSPARTR